MDCDILIAGGGMVGASLAIQLAHFAQGRLRIALVEPFAMRPAREGVSPPLYQPSFDARSSALSYGSALIFQQLGLWPALLPQLQPITQISVTERGRLGSMAMRCEDMQWPALGYVTENAWLGRVLQARLFAEPAISVISPAKVAAIKPLRDGMRVSLADEQGTQALTAQLVVVADGADSALRAQLGIAVSRRDYRQQAVVCNIGLECDHRGCAYERFDPAGPLALLPLPHRAEARAALIWSRPPAQAQQLQQMDEAQFLQQLQQCFGRRLGRLQRVGQRYCYPLVMQQAREIVRSGLVLMGNAAHSLHPVAGQGFNLGLRDCTRLSQVLLDACKRAEPLGSLQVLQRYAQQQVADQQRTLAFSDRLIDIFAGEAGGSSAARLLGLGLLDSLPALHQYFVREAAGVGRHAVFAVRR